MLGRLSDRVLSWIDASLAAFGHGFIRRVDQGRAQLPAAVCRKSRCG